MDRTDLADVRQRHPTLEPVWQERRTRLQQERTHIVDNLAVGSSTPRGAGQDRADSYRAVIRLDRSLSFLDRALVHLDDLDKDTRHAERIPLSLHPEQYR